VHQELVRLRQYARENLEQIQQLQVRFATLVLGLYSVEEISAMLDQVIKPK